jgi:hypothetical protein
MLDLELMPTQAVLVKDLLAMVAGVLLVGRHELSTEGADRKRRIVLSGIVSGRCCGGQVLVVLDQGPHRRQGLFNPLRQVRVCMFFGIGIKVEGQIPKNFVG